MNNNSWNLELRSFWSLLS